MSLIVTVSGKTSGIIREQDLFFDMERLINRCPDTTGNWRQYSQES